MRSDAHVHLDVRLEKQLKTQDIKALISCANPHECEIAQSLCQQFSNLSMSCGIHPWYVDKTSWEEMETWLKHTNIIGEIGMDNVWCSTDVVLQEELFEKQVAFAMEHKKPVVLHTKGQEKRIAEIIEHYPNTYLVHWYSSMDHLELYINDHTYFSIGPSVGEDESVQQVVAKVDIEHLLIETDGMSAIEWALHHPVGEEDYISVLDDIAMYIAKEKQLTIEQVWHQVNENYERFLQKEL